MGGCVGTACGGRQKSTAPVPTDPTSRSRRLALAARTAAHEGRGWRQVAHARRGCASVGRAEANELGFARRAVATPPHAPARPPLPDRLVAALARGVCAPECADGRVTAEERVQLFTGLGRESACCPLALANRSRSRPPTGRALSAEGAGRPAWHRRPPPACVAQWPSGRPISYIGYVALLTEGGTAACGGATQAASMRTTHSRAQHSR